MRTKAYMLLISVDENKVFFNLHNMFFFLSFQGYGSHYDVGMHKSFELIVQKKHNTCVLFLGITS
jgi:hypothetical protein